MLRIPRSRLGEGVFHVLNRGINRSAIFGEEGDKKAFFDLLVEYRRRFAVRVLHWVIMGNHFHLVLEVVKVRELSAFMAGLQRKYTAIHHRKRRERGDDACGYLWQGRFKSPLVERGRHLFAVGMYVERNPVRAGLVERPWTYRWSSARDYTFGEKGVLTDVSYNRDFLSLGATSEERAEAWRSYLMDFDAEKDEALFRGGRKRNRPRARLSESDFKEGRGGVFTTGIVSVSEGRKRPPPRMIWRMK